MKPLVALIAFAFALISPFAVGEEKFPELEAAKQRAVNEKKDILVLFTGPTWCEPCRELERDVWGIAEKFKEIEKNYVTVYAESKKPGKGTPKELQHHAALASHLGAPPVYPSIVILDKSGEPFETIEGYSGGGGEVLLARLAGVRASHNAKEAIGPILAKAHAAKNADDRAVLIREAAGKIPTQQVAVCLVPELNRLADLDSDNALGLRRRYRTLAAVLELNHLSIVDKPDRAIELTSIFLDEHKTETDNHPELKSLYLRIRFQAFYFKKNREKCFEILDQLKLIDENPDEIERTIEKLKKEIPVPDRARP